MPWLLILALAAAVAACGYRPDMKAPGQFTVALGSHVSADVITTGLNLRAKHLSVSPDQMPITLKEKAGLLYADLPPPQAVGIVLHFHQSF